MRAQRIILILAVVTGLAYGWLAGGLAPLTSMHASAAERDPAAAGDQSTQGNTRNRAKATFAAGCFWCVEADFDKVRGVLSTISGYIGGRVTNPTYEQVSRGGTGHAEAVEITFDPTVVTYDELLRHFWRNVDPFTANRQFCDIGDQYRPEIFVHDATQRAAAEASKKQVEERLKRPVVVRITEAGPFYRAEDYHQDYYKTHSAQYRFYRWGCGRDARLRDIWGDT